MVLKLKVCLEQYLNSQVCEILQANWEPEGSAAIQCSTAIKAFIFLVCKSESQKKSQGKRNFRTVPDLEV